MSKKLDANSFNASKVSSSFCSNFLHFTYVEKALHASVQSVLSLDNLIIKLYYYSLLICVKVYEFIDGEFPVYVKIET